VCVVCCRAETSSHLRRLPGPFLHLLGPLEVKRQVSGAIPSFSPCFRPLDFWTSGGVALVDKDYCRRNFSSVAPVLVGTPPPRLRSKTSLLSLCSTSPPCTFISNPSNKSHALIKVSFLSSLSLLSVRLFVLRCGPQITRTKFFEGGHHFPVPNFL